MTGSYRSRPSGDAPRGRSARPPGDRYRDAAAAAPPYGNSRYGEADADDPGQDYGSPAQRGYGDRRGGWGPAADASERPRQRSQRSRDEAAWDRGDPADMGDPGDIGSRGDRGDRGTRGTRGAGARPDGGRDGGWRGGERGGGGRGGGPGGEPPRGRSEAGGPLSLNPASLAVLAGVLVVGIGIGTGISSTTQGDQGNIASSQQLDMAVPDPEFCRQWGASAFVMDVEIYTTMNPSSSFVTQPQLRPGCVIRRENWSVLQKEGAVTAEQMRTCKQRMNTFAYVGSVKDKPIVRCVYQTDISENKFITKGIAEDAAGLSPEAQQF